MRRWLLHLTGEDGVKAIDLDQGEVRYTLPPGIASLDGGRVYTAFPAKTGTRVDVYSGADGAMLASQRLSGRGICSLV
jgi:hypothetical protein